MAAHALSNCSIFTSGAHSRRRQRARAPCTVSQARSVASSRHHQRCAASDTVSPVSAQPVVPPAAEDVPPPRALWWMWNGYDVRYTCAGLHNDGPAVVCVHGFGGNADHWRKNTGPLAACGFRVFSIDLLGYGYSSKPAPVEETPNSVYNFETWAAQLKDFCACVAGGPAFLVTNSVGGVAALQCAVSFPECVRGVVLMNVSLRGLHTSKQLPFMRPLITAFQRTLRTSNLGKSFFASVAQPQTVKNILREAYCDKSAVTDELVDAILKPGMQPGAAAVFLDFISYSTGPLAEELLPKVSAPVLTLWGQRDPWEDVRLARGLYTPEAVPGVVTAFVELPGVGHCPQDEAPHLVNPLVADFIRKHS